MCTNNDCQNEFATSSPMMQGIDQRGGDILITAGTKKMDFEGDGEGSIAHVLV